MFWYDRRHWSTPWTPLPALLALLDALPDDSPFLRLDPPPEASAEAFLAALLGDDPRLAPLKQLLEELGMRPLQAHCHLGLGTLYATVGQRDQVGAALTTAIEMYRAMDMTFWLPQAEAALTQIV